MADAHLLAAQTPASLAYVTTQGRWLPFEHLLRIDEMLVKVARREINRLIVQAPIRHGKSELISRYFPAWYLGRFPDHQVMLASYEATMARSWGRKARDVLAEHGRSIFGVNVSQMPAAADWWTVDGRDGVMVTAGVGGALTGKGADVLIIDDPVKNAAEAGSQVMRDNVWDWWQSTARSRLQPHGAVVVVMARWHEDDLAGRLLAQNDDEWTVLTLPAIAESADDPMGREPGEALCREMFDEEALAATKASMGVYWFSALLQQRPAPAEGLLFKREHFRQWEIVQMTDGAVPQFCYLLKNGADVRHIDTGFCTVFQTADVAASDKTTADYTVISTWAVTPQRDLILLDVQRQHFETLEVAPFLERVNDERDNPPVWIEAFGAGMVPIRIMRRDGYPVMELTPDVGSRVDKISRAFAAVAAYERHAVFHPASRPSWLDEYEQELLAFPNAKNDDQVDTVSYAARLLPKINAGRRAAVDKPPSRRPLTAGVMGAQF